MGQELRRQSGCEFGDGGDVLAGATRGVLNWDFGQRVLLNRLLNSFF